MEWSEGDGPQGTPAGAQPSIGITHCVYPSLFHSVSYVIASVLFWMMDSFRRVAVFCWLELFLTPCTVCGGQQVLRKCNERAGASEGERKTGALQCLLSSCSTCGDMREGGPCIPEVHPSWAGTNSFPTGSFVFGNELALPQIPGHSSETEFTVIGRLLGSRAGFTNLMLFTNPQCLPCAGFWSCGSEEEQSLSLSSFRIVGETDRQTDTLSLVCKCLSERLKV